jgi:hypothetical protein
MAETCLEELHGRYLRAVETPHPSSTNLRFSEMGSCPRKLALRWRGAPRRPESPLRTYERLRMFESANYQHDLLGKALDHFGVLLQAEVDMGSLLPEGVSGRPDYLVDMEKYLRLGDPDGQYAPGNSIWELKTPDPRVADNPERTPRHEDILQVMIADVLGREAFELTYNPRLIVAVAGGKGPMYVFEIPREVYEGEAKALVEFYLAERTKVLADPDYLPAKMEPVAQMKGTTKVVEAAHWNCNVTWCPYCYWSCRPIEPDEVVLAERPRRRKGQVEEPDFALTEAGQTKGTMVSACLGHRAKRLAMKLSMQVATPYDDWVMPSETPPCDSGSSLPTAESEDDLDEDLE